MIPITFPPVKPGACSLVMIGASWGGLNALKILLQALKPDFMSPIVFVQHRSADSDDALIKLLQRHTEIQVVEAQDKEPLCERHLYVAPPDYHTLIDGNAIALSLEEAVNHSRPAIDVLFESGAHVWKSNVTAVLLTGASEDGARGLRAVKAAGGRAYVQDPKTAESPDMPAAGLKALGMEKGMSLEEIAAAVGGACP